MKTFSILFIGLVLFGTTALAQKIYIRGGLGVAVSTAATYTQDYSSGSGIDFTTTSKKQGLGTGLPFILAAGYNLNEHFSIELGIDYFYGFTYKQTFKSANSSSASKGHGQMLSLVPAFVMSIPLDKFKPYARLGLKLGILNSVVSENHLVPLLSNPSGTTDNKIKNYGGIAVGVQAAVGTDFKLSDLLSLFGEIQVDGISWAPKHGKYVEYSVNGVDQLGSRTVKDNEWNYVKVVDGSKTIPNDQPNEYNKMNDHFGNVGLVLGVKVNL
jgi:hypothetical protein